MSSSDSKDEALLPTDPFGFRVGCIGGGQLGRMMQLEAPRINIGMSFLDPLGDACPAAAACGKNATILKGKLNDAEQLRALAKASDIVTCEIEHFDTETLQELEDEGYNVQPKSRVVRTIQDKFVQKVRI